MTRAGAPPPAESRPAFESWPELRTADFDYALPEELIAQEPAPSRDASRLLVLDRSTGSFSDHRFSELPSLLPPRALLVVNDSRVFPARLRGRKASGGAVEVLLVRAEGDAQGPPLWSALCRSSKGLRPGQVIHFAGGCEVGDASATVEETGPDGAARLAFHLAGAAEANREPRDAHRDASLDPFLRWVHAVGETPLPPYIRRPEGERPFDRERYQTVYARSPGSVAAPTAGLHFTPALLETLEAAGIPRVHLTLHVGPGTFRPVRADAVEEHRMDEEHVEIGAAAVNALGRARAEGRPLIAVGTTTVRALESAAARPGGLAPGRFATDLFIRPGHSFALVDGLVTNFHLPRSTLLMLVAALAGRDRVLGAYRHAVKERYRFYSYGDAMLIR